jgi:hypothetical protein
MVALFEKIRRETIQESLMAQTGPRSHLDCTPWTPFTVQDLFIIHEVESFVPLDDDYFNKQVERSGIEIAGSMEIGHGLKRGQDWVEVQGSQTKKARN